MAHKISPESFDGINPPLELFSLKEKVTLLPGGLFYLLVKNKRSELRFQFLRLEFFPPSHYQYFIVPTFVLNSGSYACSGQLC